MGDITVDLSISSYTVNGWTSFDEENKSSYSMKKGIIKN